MIAKMSHKYQTRKTPVYGNIQVIHPNGSLMFCANDKKARWYLSRGLAVVIRDYPPAIQLTFEPKGPGRAGDHQSLIYKQNICVVCGSEDVDSINRHHIVPYCYRRHFPVSIKERNDYDVVAICFDCHSIYEQLATKLKRQIAKDYKAPLDIAPTEEMLGRWQASKAAHTLRLYREVIPNDRILYLEKRIRQYLGKSDGDYLTDDEINKMADIGLKTGAVSKEFLHGHQVAQVVLSSETSIHAFFLLWRQHFIQTVSPKFMPAGWHEKLPITYLQREKRDVI